MAERAGVLACVLLLNALGIVAARAEDPVEQLLDKLTLEEKIGQLLQFTPDQAELKPALAKGTVGSVLATTGPQQSLEFQRAALAGSRLKIPLLVGHDVIHGYRTIFPIPLAIASSWDPDLAELSSQIAAREARAAGIHWTFAPMLDVARDPRWGRIAEGSGEDPLLGSLMAVGYVRGFQGANPTAPDRVLACAKHFAAYGAALGGRDYAQREISERTLREVYLPPFQAAVNAGVATIMSAFSTVADVPPAANAHLLQDILRHEWRFRGLVVSDWAAVAELLIHGVAATREEAALKAITSGVDMDMFDNAFTTLAAAVRDGRLKESILDDAVRRVLRAKADAGLFAAKLPERPPKPAATIPAEHRAAARRVAERSIVLLKNEGALPLALGNRKLAVIGPLADARADMLGPWYAEGRGEEAVSLVDALRAKGIAFRTARGGDIATATDEEIARAVDLAKDSDVVIAALGESRDMSGEAASRATLDLPGRQQELFNALEGTGKRLVVVLFAGRPLTIGRIAQRADALVQAWFLGTEAGAALADALLGNVNPSGKLPVTWPRSVGQIPIFYAHLPTGRPGDVKTKWTSKYIDLELDPLYPFGHGLTYTRFEYSNLTLSAPAMPLDGRIDASATVRNVGVRPGDEIVQLYIRDVAASVSRPVRELKAFRRIALVPGASTTVTFTITRNELQFWLGNAWVTEPGEFKVWIAPDAASGLEASFTVTP